MKDDVNKNLSKQHNPRFGEIAVDMGLADRDWFEDRNSYYETVNTHNYDIRILLINRLRNQ